MRIYTFSTAQVIANRFQSTVMDMFYSFLASYRWKGNGNCYRCPLAAIKKRKKKEKNHQNFSLSPVFFLNICMLSASMSEPTAASLYSSPSVKSSTPFFFSSFPPPHTISQQHATESHDTCHLNICTTHQRGDHLAK